MTFYLAGSVETHRESHIHPYVHICTHYHLKRAPKYIEAGAADILYTETRGYTQGVQVKLRIHLLIHPCRNTNILRSILLRTCTQIQTHLGVHTYTIVCYCVCTFVHIYNHISVCTRFTCIGMKIHENMRIYTYMDMHFCFR